jgi:uncharacterized membrane protein YdjX (TVP38/TMEM64 family)
MSNHLHRLWRRVTHFFVNLDAKLVRAIWISVLLFVLVAATFLLGKSAWGKGVMNGLNGWMAQYAHSPLAVIIVIVVFCVTALFGAPQFVLIAACVHVFGAWWGGVYSWIATVVSAAMTFYIGRFTGNGMIAKLGGERVNKLSEYIGKNAFTASFIVRNLPSAPFIVVNMAFGASRASFSGFILGCALGVLPKTALVAMFGNSYEAMTHGNWQLALLMAAVALAWLGLMIVARRVYERGRGRES